MTTSECKACGEEIRHIQLEMSGGTVLPEEVDSHPQPAISVDEFGKYHRAIIHTLHRRTCVKASQPGASFVSQETADGLTEEAALQAQAEGQLEPPAPGQ